jgi:hypothetical protein
LALPDVKDRLAVRVDLNRDTHTGLGLGMEIGMQHFAILTRWHSGIELL